MVYSCSLVSATTGCEPLLFLLLPFLFVPALSYSSASRDNQICFGRLGGVKNKSQGASNGISAAGVCQVGFDCPERVKWDLNGKGASNGICTVGVRLKWSERQERV